MQLAVPASKQWICLPAQIQNKRGQPNPHFKLYKEKKCYNWERDIKKIFYFNEKENQRFKKNALKANLSGSSYLRSLITNYQPKDAPSDTILLPIIAELKSVGKTVNEIAITANRFDFINTKYANRVIERIDFISDEIREKLITSI